MSALDLATATKCCRRATRERHSFATLRQVDGRWGRALYRTADTPTEQAFVYSGFYGADESNVGDTRALTLWRASCRRAWSGSARRVQLVLASAAPRPAPQHVSVWRGVGERADPPKVKALVAKLAAIRAS